VTTSPTEFRSLPGKNPAVFIVGLVALAALFLPPLPFSLFSNTPLRWDYILIPPLVIYAAWITWKSRASWSELGLTFENFKPALRYLILPTLIGAIILLVIGFTLKPDFKITLHFFKRLIPLNGFAQQLVIQIFFHRQLMSWFGTGRKTAWILTLYFVALHFPNPGLMLGTAIGMYFWARCYQLHPNIYALSLSHAFLSALLMECMPKWLLPSVSIGYRFIEKGIKNNWWGWFNG
jgi:hypothetical protein